MLSIATSSSLPSRIERGLLGSGRKGIDIEYIVFIERKEGARSSDFDLPELALERCSAPSERSPCSTSFSVVSQKVGAVML